MNDQKEFEQGTIGNGPKVNEGASQESGFCFGKNDIYDKIFWSVLLLLGGSIWLMEALEYIDYGWGKYFWPFAAIWLGTMILARIVFENYQKNEEKTINARLRYP